jgi:NAD(P)-dependent dehydrogenase (short-subunit alcohol dehydrogenase family)
MGLALGPALARRGVDIAFTFHRSREPLDAAAEAVRAAGCRALVLAADLSDASGCQQAVDETARAFGRLDILVNLASRYVRYDLESLTGGAFEQDLAVDLGSSFHCSMAAVPHMRKVGGGRILNCADWVAASGRPRYRGYLPYYVAKKGVIALTEALALELAPDRILVNALAPGPIVPAEAMTQQERDAVVRVTPLGRWGGEEAFVSAALSLIETDFITGETVRVDGGRHLA